MVEIIPAIIPKSFAELENKMSLVSELASIVQIDVMDGVFVPEKCWPYVKAGGATDPDFAAILKEEKGFPFWEEIDFEVDLMVANPEKVWEDWLIAGAKRVIVHIESTSDPLSLITKIKKRLPGSDSLLYTEIGIAINIDTPNEKIYPLIAGAGAGSGAGDTAVDFVQFMGIAKIGFQGQPFDERVVAKIADLRGKYPNVTISVDGGVNTTSAPKLSAVGVNRLVVGSAIFESENVSETLVELQSLTEA